MSDSKGERRKWFVGLGITVLVVTVIAWPIAYHRANAWVGEVKCVNHMVSIGLGGYMWASENEGALPKTFFSMSNELGSPLILVCPSKKRPPLGQPWDPEADYYDYEIVATNRMINTNGRTLFIRCKVHGFLGYAGGEVFDGKRYRKKWPN
ncbi:MAG: hypothetical protein ACPGVU_26780 [Limisphaerales bacterium]